MASISEAYANSVRQDSGLYFAAWSPEARYNLGDVGILQNGKMFVQKTRLLDEGIDFEEEPDEDPGAIDLTSKRDVSVSLKVSGEANSLAPSIPSAKAGVAVSFGRSSSYVIRSEEVYEPRIRNMASVEREVMERFTARRWQKEWVIISQLVHCTKVDILISKSSNTKVEIMAKGEVAAGQTVNLGNVGADFAVTTGGGAVYNFLNTKNATPLFQSVGIRSRFPFGKSKIGTRGSVQEDPYSVILVEEAKLREHTDALFLGAL